MKLTSMNLPMRRQIHASSETLSADITFVVSFVGVDPSMYHQRILPAESLSTEFTLIIFNIRVFGNRVVFQVSPLSKLHFALITLVRLLTWGLCFLLEKFKFWKK